MLGEAAERALQNQMKVADLIGARIPYNQDPTPWGGAPFLRYDVLCLRGAASVVSACTL